LKAAGRAIATIVGDINQPDRRRADYTALIEHLASLTAAVQPEDTSDAEEEIIVSPEVEEAVSQAAAAEEVEYDAEIAAIFTEESAELLEAADKALHAWTDDKDSRQPMEELKRHLHTLKGGARMAGISAMGNLSHELETLLLGVDEGRVKTTSGIDELLQLSLDELHRMRDSVMANKPVAAAAELEKRIQQANAGFEIADDSDVEMAPADRTVEKADPAPFTIEPHDTVSMVIVDSPLVDELAVIRQPSAEEKPAAKAPAAEPPPEQPEQTEKAPAIEPEKEPEPVPAQAPEPVPVQVMTRIAPAAIPPEPASARAKGGEQRQEFARIDADLLEDLLNAAGEISIYHSRLSQQVNLIEFNVIEMEATVARLREQLRKLDIETEAQIMHSHQDTLAAKDFDPLELDRYSNLQQLSRALAESSNDLSSLKDLLQNLTTEAEVLLVQQSRVTAELQDGLMRTRMVPFERHVPRLTRLVRQIAQEADKRAELAVEGASGELDRQVLEKMLPPFEHMLRNAIVHGIEPSGERQQANKPATGRITIRLHREGVLQF
jgi:chemosensory pili system protein ChpA (sensor histidine kinase/response regulator)